jgi:hypothetical protein
MPARRYRRTRMRRACRTVASIDSPLRQITKKGKCSMRVRVESVTDYRGVETPRRFHLDGPQAETLASTPSSTCPSPEKARIAVGRGDEPVRLDSRLARAAGTRTGTQPLHAVTCCITRPSARTAATATPNAKTTTGSTMKTSFPSLDSMSVPSRSLSRSKQPRAGRRHQDRSNLTRCYGPSPATRITRACHHGACVQSHGCRDNGSSWRRELRSAKLVLVMKTAPFGPHLILFMTSLGSGVSAVCPSEQQPPNHHQHENDEHFSHGDTTCVVSRSRIPVS